MAVDDQEVDPGPRAEAKSRLGFLKNTLPAVWARGREEGKVRQEAERVLQQRREHTSSVLNELMSGYEKSKEHEEDIVGSDGQAAKLEVTVLDIDDDQYGLHGSVKINYRTPEHSVLVRCSRGFSSVLKNPKTEADKGILYGGTEWVPEKHPRYMSGNEQMDVFENFEPALKTLIADRSPQK